jgi:hypothetical protein
MSYLYFQFLRGGRFMLRLYYSMLCTVQSTSVFFTYVLRFTNNATIIPFGVPLAIFNFSPHVKKFSTVV